MSRPLDLIPTIDNTSGFTSISGLHETNLQRDIGIFIRESNSGFSIIPNGNQGFFSPNKPWAAECLLTSTSLFECVDECRQTWQQTLVDGNGAFEARTKPVGGKENYYFFQRQWDFAGEPQVLQQRAGKLALAGAKLFYLLFEDIVHPQELRDIGAELKRASREKELVLTITSDSFFVPWGMIYVHPDPDTELLPDGSNFDWQGFWGFRHIIEHNPKYVALDNVLRIDTSQKLRFSANVDEQIDISLGIPCVKPLIEFFQGHSLLDTMVRKTSSELQTALSDNNFADRILFFCCHGRGSRDNKGVLLDSPAIKLTDTTLIKVSDLKFWSKQMNGVFPSRPLVFINACQGGQMTNLFYKDLASEFLRQQAVGLVGSQIDIPVIFAREYAELFFKKLLDLNNGPVRVGPLMRELTREYIEKHNNPLGLAYSLYRGADCFVANT